jgi:hypothetical protein
MLTLDPDNLAQPWASGVTDTSWTQLQTGWSDPDVAINDVGIVAIVYRDSQITNSAGLWLSKLSGTPAKLTAESLVDHATCTLTPRVSLSNNNIIAIVSLTGIPGPAMALHYQVGLVSDDVNNPSGGLTVSWGDSGQVPGATVAAMGCDVVVTDDNDIIVINGTANQGLYSAVGALDNSNPTAPKVQWTQQWLPFGQGQRPTVGVSGDTVLVFAEGYGDYQGQVVQYIGKLVSVASGKVIQWQKPASYVQAGARTVSVATFRGGSFMEIHAVSTSAQTNASLVATAGQLVPENFDNWQPSNGAHWLKYSGAWGNKSTSTIVTLGSTHIREMDPGPSGPAYKDQYISGPENKSSG